jgi:tetratricopeptide (TPR) repeat protein
MMEEIGGVYDGEAEGGGKWQVGVALVAACDTAVYSYGNKDKNKWKDSIAAHERALRMRLDTLGEQHPATAATLQSIGASYSNMGSYDTAIMLGERALRIDKDTLGLHPTTAHTMSNIGAAYGNKEQHKKAIELFEQALRIYERTVGRMHRDAAYAILNMSTAYYNLGDLVKAEELGKEALVIYEKTLGPDHELTKEARHRLDIIQKAKSRGGGALKEDGGACVCQ